MSIPKQADAVGKHLAIKRKVRALETRSFKWFPDYQLGYEDVAWTRFTMNTGQWNNYPYSGQGVDLATIKKHDTVYFRGYFTPSESALPGAPDVLVGYCSSDHRPEVDQEVLFTLTANKAGWVPVNYVGKLEAATGKLLLPFPITMPGDIVDGGHPVGQYDRFQCYSQHWPAVNFS